METRETFCTSVPSIHLWNKNYNLPCQTKKTNTANKEMNHLGRSTWQGNKMTTCHLTIPICQVFWVFAIDLLRHVMSMNNSSHTPTVLRSWKAEEFQEIFPCALNGATYWHHFMDVCSTDSLVGTRRWILGRWQLRHSVGSMPRVASGTSSSGEVQRRHSFISGAVFRLDWDSPWRTNWSCRLFRCSNTTTRWPRASPSTASEK